MKFGLCLVLVSGLFGCAAGVQGSDKGQPSPQSSESDSDGANGGMNASDSMDASDGPSVDHDGGARASSDAGTDADRRDGSADAAAADACDPGWADCDGDTVNGCERDTDSLGPCLPQPDCVFLDHDGRDYYFCPGALSWAAARANCRLQTNGDLVAVDDAAENAFLQTNLTGDAWLGSSDARLEGEWHWLPDDSGTADGPQFWAGDAGGSAVGGAYANWGSGEPNDAADQDCGLISRDNGGVWDDQSCGIELGYICEISVP